MSTISIDKLRDNYKFLWMQRLKIHYELQDETMNTDERIKLRDSERTGKMFSLSP